MNTQYNILVNPRRVVYSVMIRNSEDRHLAWPGDRSLDKSCESWYISWVLIEGRSHPFGEWPEGCSKEKTAKSAEPWGDKRAGCFQEVHSVTELLKSALINLGIFNGLNLLFCSTVWLWVFSSHEKYSSVFCMCSFKQSILMKAAISLEHNYLIVWACSALLHVKMNHCV